MAEKQSLGKAYVQIIPTADGISGTISSLFAGAEQGLTSKLGSVVKKVIAGAGITKLFQTAISEGMNLEQNMGGAEAVFGDYAENIKNIAKTAFKDMGMSQSQYLASANKMVSLLKGSGMETSSAMDMASKAMQRAADVASVMGISTEEAMNAINGAAKGNFTMMDNLGVAMNATTLQAYALEKGMNNFNYSTATNAEKTALAMEMFMERTTDSAGNFAREASETMSGSIGAVKSAFQDLVGNLATGGDITNAMEGLVTYSLATVKNLGGAVINIVKTLPGAIIQVVSSIGFLLKENWESASEQVLTAVTESIPNYIISTLEVIGNILGTIVDELPSFLEKGGDLLASVIEGITSKIPDIMSTIGTILVDLLKKFIEHLPEFIDSGFKILGALMAGLYKALGGLLEGAVDIAAQLWEKFQNLDWITLGKNILDGIAKGITNSVGDAVRAAANAASAIWKKVTSYFGIHSPSRKMAWVGEMLDKGLAGGIDDNTSLVDKAVNELNDTINPSLQGEILSTMAYDNAVTSANVQNSVISNNNDKLAELLESGQIVVVLDSGEMVGALTSKFDESFGQLQLRKARG